MILIEILVFFKNGLFMIVIVIWVLVKMLLICSDNEFFWIFNINYKWVLKVVIVFYFEYEEKILYVGVCLNILYVIKRSGC